VTRRVASRIAGAAMVSAAGLSIAPAAAQAPAPIEITVPAGLTTANFGEKLQPTVTCRATSCSVKLSAQVSKADQTLFGLPGRVVGSAFEELVLPRDESDDVALFSERNGPKWQPIADAARLLPTKRTQRIDVVASVTADDQTSTVTVPVDLKWPKVKTPSGRGHTGGIRRVVVPRRISLRASRARIQVYLAPGVRKGILQSAMIGPGGATGFLGKFEVTHGGRVDIPMLVSKERRMVRRAKGFVPTTGKVEIFLARQDGGRPDDAARFFTFVR
jgi:hypothetical protein